MCVLMSKRGIDQFTTALGAGPKTQRAPGAPCGSAGPADAHCLRSSRRLGTTLATDAVPLSRLPLPLHECRSSQERLSSPLSAHTLHSFRSSPSSAYLKGRSVLSSLKTRSIPRIFVPLSDTIETRMSMTEMRTSTPSSTFQLLFK